MQLVPAAAPCVSSRRQYLAPQGQAIFLAHCRPPPSVLQCPPRKDELSQQLQRSGKTAQVSRPLLQPPSQKCLSWSFWPSPPQLSSLHETSGRSSSLPWLAGSNRWHWQPSCLRQAPLSSQSRRRPEEHSSGSRQARCETFSQCTID